MKINHCFNMIGKLLKEIREDVRNAKKWLKSIVAFIAIVRIRRKARKLHRKNNCQIFVVKMGGKVRLISKEQFKYLRQRGKFPKNFTAEQLKKIALYHTPKRYDKKRVSGTVK